VASAPNCASQRATNHPGCEKYSASAPADASRGGTDWAANATASRRTTALTNRASAGLASVLARSTA
jgi:hypothetical protein